MKSRRSFLKQSAAALAGATLPVSLVELAFAQEQENFTFAYISDSHIQQIKGANFVRNFDRGLIRAVAEANLMDPRPDFVVYGGDIAQIGIKPEIDHGLEILSALNMDIHYVMGEHDYYHDLGEYWERQLGPQYYSFDHKGVHFVVLNSILTDAEWTNKWSSGAERMGVMAGLDNPLGSPFMVGKQQRDWLKDDLKQVHRNTPLVIFSHSPLQKIYKGWNFWTEDAEEIQAILKPYRKVNVFYGHVHQIQYNQIGNISFHAAMATAWPWPYPQSYSQQESLLPRLTVPMNRADPFQERDATGWQFIDIWSGNADFNYVLADNSNRTVGFDKRKGYPVDKEYQNNQNPAQTHF